MLSMGVLEGQETISYGRICGPNIPKIWGKAWRPGSGLGRLSPIKQFHPLCIERTIGIGGSPQTGRLPDI